MSNTVGVTGDRRYASKEQGKSIKCYVVLNVKGKPFDNDEGDVPVYFDKQSALSNSLDENLKVKKATLTWK